MNGFHQYDVHFYDQHYNNPIYGQHFNNPIHGQHFNNPIHGQHFVNPNFVNHQYNQFFNNPTYDQHSYIPCPTPEPSTPEPIPFTSSDQIKYDETSSRSDSKRSSIKALFVELIVDYIGVVLDFIISILFLTAAASSIKSCVTPLNNDCMKIAQETIKIEDPPYKVEFYPSVSLSSYTNFAWSCSNERNRSCIAVGPCYVNDSYYEAHKNIYDDCRCKLFIKHGWTKFGFIVSFILLCKSILVFISYGLVVVLTISCHYDNIKIPKPLKYLMTVLSCGLIILGIFADKAFTEEINDFKQMPLGCVITEDGSRRFLSGVNDILGFIGLGWYFLTWCVSIFTFLYEHRNKL